MAELDMRNEDIQRLGKLLERLMQIFEKDRKMAEDNYTALRQQLDNILEKDMESSEDGKVEAEVNKALKLVFDSATRLQNVMDTISKIIVAQLNADAKREVAQMFSQGGGATPIKRVNIQALIEGPRKTEDEEGGPDED